MINVSHKKQVSLEGSGEINVSQDQKIVLDFIDAIHAAEKKQAESDFRFFDMEKQKMKVLHLEEYFRLYIFCLILKKYIFDGFSR